MYVLIFGALAAVGCSAATTGSSSSTTSIRLRTTTDDLSLLRTITTEVLVADLAVEEQVVATDVMRCSTSGGVDNGRRAALTLKLETPDGGVVSSLGEVTSAFRDVSDEHFDGTGSVQDDSATSQGSVDLYAEGFWVGATVIGDDWTLDATGPCRL